MTDRQQALEQQKQQNIEQTAGSAAAQAAASATHSKLQERKQNPEFFDQLRDLGIDTSEYPWISERLGPLQAGAHLIGNRDERYETEVRWLDQNRAERVIAEAEPGRLCKGRVLEIAQRVHDRDDKEAVSRMTVDERRVVRSAMEAVTNFKTLSIDNTGLSSLTDATTVTKSEKNEIEESSKSRRLGRVIG